MERRAYGVLRGKMGRIKESNVDPAQVAEKSLAANIIGKEDADAASDASSDNAVRWEKLMDAALNSRRKDAFQSFVTILLGQPDLRYLAEDIREEFEKQGGVWKEETHGKSQEEFPLQGGSRRGEHHGTSGVIPDEVKKLLPLVDNSTLEKEDLIDIEGIVIGMASKWNDFGKALRIPDQKLKEIKAMPGSTPRSCLGETLVEFLNKNYKWQKYGPPSWRMIVQAVAHRAGGDNTALALEIARDHTSGTAPTAVGEGSLQALPVVQDHSTEPRGSGTIKHTPEDFARFPKPDIVDLMECVGVDLQVKWKRIGSLLGLTQPQLAAINTGASRTDPDQDCMTQVFTRWHDGMTSEYSWKHLAEVLLSKSVNEPAQLNVMYNELTKKRY